jgi:hypothetical protein
MYLFGCRTFGSRIVKTASKEPSFGCRHRISGPEQSAEASWCRPRAIGDRDYKFPAGYPSIEEEGGRFRAGPSGRLCRKTKPVPKIGSGCSRLVRGVPSRDPYRGVWGCANARSGAGSMGPALVLVTIQHLAGPWRSTMPLTATPGQCSAEGGMRRAPTRHPNARPPTVGLKSDIAA